MTANDVIRMRMKDQKVTSKDLSKALGYKSGSAVRQRLIGNMRVDILINMLDALGCELVIRPKEEEGEWVITEGLED